MKLTTIPKYVFVQYDCCGELIYSMSGDKTKLVLNLKRLYIFCESRKIRKYKNLYCSSLILIIDKSRTKRQQMTNKTLTLYNNENLNDKEPGMSLTKT